MTILAFILHLLIDFLLGIGVLSLLKKEKLAFGQFFIALLIGMAVETMTTFTLMWIGAPLPVAFGLTILLALVLNIPKALQFFKNPAEFSIKIKDSFTVFRQFTVFDALFLPLIFQKISMVIWQLLRTPTLHSDALKHWSTQGRLIYSQINFSLLPNTAEFLGNKAQVIEDYPLQIPIWRANSAILNNGWNEFVSRSDGLLFFIAICGIVGATTWMLTKKRWLALSAAFIVASLPLQVWHGAGGYADIAVEAFLVGAIACFINKELLLCGILTAGAVWSKNDGFVLYFPGILAAVLSVHLFKKKLNFSKEIKKVGQFFAGFALILPWMIFQNLYSYSIFGKFVSPLKKLFSAAEVSTNNNPVISQNKFDESPSSIELLWDYVFTGSAFGIFWIMIFLGLIFLSKKLLSDLIGRGLILFFVLSSAVIYFVFTFTPAYEYLLTQTTIHRVLLQFSAAALLVVGYGVSLHKEGVRSEGSGVSPL